MSRKTRKLIWSAPLVAVLAVAGALAIFAAQMPGTALAHDPPGVVGNLTGEADGTTQIDLSWDAPSGGATTGYRIDRSSDGNTWVSHEMNHASTTYSDTGLDPNMAYYYRVFAVNSAGAGPVSQEYRVQTDAVVEPGAVIGLTATKMGQNQVNLAWTMPSEDGGGPVTKYSIHFASAVSEIPTATEVATNDGVIDVDAKDGTSYQHKMRIADTTYVYIVYAHNSAGKSAVQSNVATATTDPLVAPGAPSGVTAVQTDARTFSLYWHAPANTGGTDPVDYQVHAAYNGSNSFTSVTTTWRNTIVATGADSADTTFAVPADLGDPASTPITSVQFRVYTITREAAPPITELKSSGYGQSPRMTIITDADTRASRIPAAPTITNDEAIRDSKSIVNLDWSAPDTRTEATPNLPPSIGGYRLDVSDDGLKWSLLIHDTRKTDTEYQYVDTENKNRHYRIFARHAQWQGPAQETAVVSNLSTAAVSPPGHVTGLTAMDAGAGQIDLSWTAPASDGNASIVRYRIDAVRRAMDTGFAALPPGTDGQVLTDGTSAEGVLYDTSTTTSYSHKKLNAGETWQYRVLAVTDDKSLADNIRTSDSRTAGTAVETTPQAALPEAPEGLVAEDAKDSSLTSSENRGVLLLWNAPNPPDGAMIDGYRIQRKKDDAAWETIVMDSHDTKTDYTDASEPAAGEMRMYQVAALNGSKMGAYSDPVYYPAMMHVPGKPTLSAMKDADMPGTKVKLTWTAPDMNADLVTGYIIERRRAGDMMGDIPSDGYNDGVMGRSFAFSNHMEWWETLNCKGMLAAAGSSETMVATPAEGSDQAMYCAHYAMTKPTNMAGTITADSDVDMKIKALFMKRYVTDDMGKTKTMFTGMMYTDMGLMPNTEYTYRVRAIHGMKAGMWSDKAMVTTTTDNTDPMPNDMAIDPVSVMAGETTEAMDVSMYFSDVDMDELTYRAMSDDDATATADIPAGGSMLTITGVAEGMTTVKVYASDGKGGTDAMRTIDVTVTPGNTDPMPNDMAIDPVSVMAGETTEAMDVSMYFSDVDMDELTYRAMSDDDATATADIPAGGSMLTITGVAEGMTTVKVYASDGKGGTDAMRTIDVTVTPALTQPTNLRIHNEGLGILIVEWDAVTGAAGFYVIAVAPGDPSDYATAVVNNPTATEAAVNELTPGNAYNVIVVAFGGGMSQVSPISNITAR